MKNRIGTIPIYVPVLGAILSSMFFLAVYGLQLMQPSIFDPIKTRTSSLFAKAPALFHYYFSIAGVVEEAGAMEQSSSPYWWVNSGARMYLRNGGGETVQGEMNKYAPWRLAYLAANPADTDQGYHPQNIFRLLTRQKWGNFREEAYFRINKYHLSSSGQRDAMNALLLFSRYTDGNNLYYAGVRVDGNAVVKKKIGGKYYTLVSKKVFPGTFNRSSNPILLPQKEEIGLRLETKNVSGGVNIKLYMDRGRTGKWELLVETTDTGTGGSALTNTGYAGIRTDFMDVRFDDYIATDSF